MSSRRKRWLLERGAITTYPIAPNRHTNALRQRLQVRRENLVVDILVRRHIQCVDEGCWCRAADTTEVNPHVAQPN